MGMSGADAPVGAASTARCSGQSPSRIHCSGERYVVPGSKLSNQIGFQDGRAIGSPDRQTVARSKVAEAFMARRKGKIEAPTAHADVEHLIGARPHIHDWLARGREILVFEFDMGRAPSCPGPPPKGYPLRLPPRRGALSRARVASTWFRRLIRASRSPSARSWRRPAQSAQRHRLPQAFCPRRGRGIAFPQARQTGNPRREDSACGVATLPEWSPALRGAFPWGLGGLWWGCSGLDTPNVGSPGAAWRGGARGELDRGARLRQRPLDVRPSSSISTARTG